MQVKLLNENQGSANLCVILAKGDDVFPSPNEFVTSQSVNRWRSLPCSAMSRSAEDGKPSLHIQCELSGRDGDPESRLALIDPGSPD